MPAWVRTVTDKIGARDVFVFGGLALICLGVGMIYPPAAPIVAGIALLVIGVVGVPSWR